MSTISSSLLTKYKLTLLRIGAGDVYWSTDRGETYLTTSYSSSSITKEFASGTKVTLSKDSPILGLIYGGFTESPCTGQSTCSITLDSDKTIVVTFSGMSNGHFTVARIGSGSITSLNTGTTIVNDSMLSSSSNALYEPRGIHILKAQANVGYTFKRWIGGDCSGSTNPECRTNFTGSSQAIVAIFE